MLSHLPLCVLGCADDIPWHCSGNTFHTLRTPLCFPNSLTKYKKMLYTSSCQLLPFASRNNLVGRLRNGLIKQKVALLVSVSHPETTFKVFPLSGTALYTTVYRGSAFIKNINNSQKAKGSRCPASSRALLSSHKHIPSHTALELTPDLHWSAAGCLGPEMTITTILFDLLLSISHNISSDYFCMNTKSCFKLDNFFLLLMLLKLNMR